MMIETFGKSFAIIRCVVTSDKCNGEKETPVWDNDMADTG